MIGDMKHAKGEEELPPLWRSQLIATVKKNVALRTGRVAMLTYIIPFVICSLLFIALSVIFTVKYSVEWDENNIFLGPFVIFYFVMSIPSILVMGKEKESGIRGLMLQVSDSAATTTAAEHVLFYYSVSLCFFC